MTQTRERWRRIERRVAAVCGVISAIALSVIVVTRCRTGPDELRFTSVSAQELIPGVIFVSFEHRGDPSPDKVEEIAAVIWAIDERGAPVQSVASSRVPLRASPGFGSAQLRYSPEQLAGVDAMSLCFSSPRSPEFGCTRAQVVHGLSSR